MRVAGVDDDWELELVGEPELRFEGSVLGVMRRQIAVEVEPDLADGDDALRGCHAAELVGGVVVPVFGVVRMDTERCPDLLMLFGDSESESAVVKGAADGDNALDAGLSRSGEDVWQVVADPRVVEMCVGVEESGGFSHMATLREAAPLRWFLLIRVSVIPS